MKATRNRHVPALLSIALLVFAGCSGEDGAAGPPGATGPSGPAGATGPSGPTGVPVDHGSIEGTVKNGVGVGVAGATVATSPATVEVTTGTDGAFALDGIPVGAYTVTASKAGYGAAAIAAIGVAGGSKSLVALTLTPASAATATITGWVRSPSGVPLAGAQVSVEGQAASATTGADGSFTLADVAPGALYLKAKAPAGFLDGGDRRSHQVAAGEELSITITLSGRPSDTATYVGEAMCTTCHANVAAAQHEAAHYHFVTPGTSRMVRKAKEMWPGVGETLDPHIQALDPIEGHDFVPVYLCQNTAGAYAMKFAGTADCAAADGTLIPVDATIGGEGDGGVDERPNFGVYKQRFLTRPRNVPYALNHWAVQYVSEADRDRDFLILPIYLVQDGNTNPAYGAVSPKFYKIYPDKWLKQERTTGRLCASCHNTGLRISFSGALSLLTAYEYKDINITCERCHGPASGHLTGHPRDRIIIPRYLTASAAQQLCAQCHSAHSGSSKNPDGAFKMPFQADNLDKLGHGVFVPGVHELADFIKGFQKPVLDGGGVETWPDRLHSKAHSQQYPMLTASKHGNNSSARLACFDCHEAHSTYFGPARFAVGAFELRSPRLNDNTLCLGCHAGGASFASVSQADVAALHSANDAVAVEGAAKTFTAQEVAAARVSIATAVGRHMEARASMGVAAYDPTNPANPVGRCSSCHMPKTAKKNDTVDVTQWHLALDGNGEIAIAEGNASSHTFDVVWPAQSGALKKASGGSDLDIMPNSCGRCHAGARLSGD